MKALLFISILLVNSASASELGDKLFKHLCNGELQRRKVEVSWTAKVDSFAGQRLDIAQEKQAKQREEIAKDANQKFAHVERRFEPRNVQEFIDSGKLEVADLSTFLGSEFVLMIPQREHADQYAEACLPQYGENQFLGYRDGKPVLSALMNNQAAIWGCYAMKNTEVLEEGEKFTARLNLAGFCKYARSADSFLSK